MSGLLLKKKAIPQIFQNPELQHDHIYEYDYTYQPWLVVFTNNEVSAI